MRQVDVSNQTIAAAAARVREAQAATQAARAALFPTVNGNAAALRSSRAAGTRRRRRTSTSTVTNSYNVALDINWEIDLWGGVRRGVESSTATAQASAADLAAATLSAQALLAQDYLLLRVQDAQIELLNDTVAGYEKSLQLTRNQYAAGIVARGDVAQAEAQLKSTQAQVLDARISRAQLEHAIAVLVGKPPSELAIAPRPLPAVFPAIPVALPSELLERRPDVAAAERRAAAANAQIGVAQAAFFPSLSLSAAGGFQSSAIGNLLSLPSRYWALGPALAQTLFDAGLRSAQKAQAVATYDETVANYRSTVLTAFPGSRGQSDGAGAPRAGGRGAGRRGQGRARVGGDRHQSVQGRDRQLPRRRGAAGGRTEQRTHPRSRSSRGGSPRASASSRPWAAAGMPTASPPIRSTHSRAVLKNFAPHLITHHFHFDTSWKSTVRPCMPRVGRPSRIS